jgi:uncharacterized membrane protein YeaQ/YmgE (transglycosylase-associated protein family)
MPADCLASLLMQHSHGGGFFLEWSPGLIGTLIFGMLAGWLTGVITRGRGYGCIVDILLGLIGAFIGRWIFFKLGIVAFGFIGNLAAAVVGAVVLVAIVRLIVGGRD